MKFRNRVRFHENHFEPVREFGPLAVRPSHLPFGSQRRHCVVYFDSFSGHYAASFTPAGAGSRNTIARFSLRKYFCAAA